MAIPKIHISSEETYRQIALGDPDHLWELYDGQLREKPPMSVEHGDVMVLLVTLLHSQLERSQFKLRASHARLRIHSGSYFIPDIAVIPVDMERALRERPGSLDAYAEPLPLVIEIWSPSTGHYDLEQKVAGYQQRGDQLIWRIHPYERTVIAWSRDADGAYLQRLYRQGQVQPRSLPDVVIDLNDLFASG